MPPGHVPHILHQTWTSENAIPRGLHRITRTWRRLQPSWTYHFHSDADNTALVEQRYPWLMPSWRRLSAIQRADVARYLYMHAWGGVYADLDVALLQPLNTLLRVQRRSHNASVILGQEPLAHAVILERKRRQVCNAVMASVPGHPFWLEVVRRVAAAQGGADPVGSTGPRMLEQVLSSWLAPGGAGHAGGGVVVVPPDAFFPTWDPMQAGTFRQRCGDAGSRRGLAPVGLEEAWEAACKRLRAESFVPTVPRDGSAYTNHLWSHTWIPGAQKANVIYG